MQNKLYSIIAWTFRMKPTWFYLGRVFEGSPDLYVEGTVHLYSPLTPSIVGVTLQHQVALLPVDHSPTLWERSAVGKMVWDWYAFSFSDAINQSLIIILMSCIRTLCLTFKPKEFILEFSKEPAKKTKKNQKKPCVVPNYTKKHKKQQQRYSALMESLQGIWRLSQLAQSSQMKINQKLI